MTMRDKLFEIIDNVQQYCSHEGTYCCDCAYSAYDSNECWKYKIADAIIESGLFCDISKVGKLLSEMFGGDCPCNYGFGDEDVPVVISEYDPACCEEHCDDEEYDKCWAKFAEAKLKE